MCLPLLDTLLSVSELFMRQFLRFLLSFRLDVRILHLSSRFREIAQVILVWRSYYFGSLNNLLNRFDLSLGSDLRLVSCSWFLTCLLFSWRWGRDYSRLLRLVDDGSCGCWLSICGLKYSRSLLVDKHLGLLGFRFLIQFLGNHFRLINLRRLHFIHYVFFGDLVFYLRYFFYDCLVDWLLNSGWFSRGLTCFEWLRLAWCLTDWFIDYDWLISLEHWLPDEWLGLVS